MTGRINRCAHCGCDEPILGIDGKLYCDNCGMSLENLSVTNRKNENRMAQVAALFGKKLNEDFKAVIWDSIMDCRFTHEGLEIKMDNGLYRNNGNWLSCLLTGEARIMEG